MILLGCPAKLTKRLPSSVGDPLASPRGVAPVRGMGKLPRPRHCSFATEVPKMARGSGSVVALRLPSFGVGLNGTPQF